MARVAESATIRLRDGVWGYSITTIVCFSEGDDDVHVHHGPATDAAFVRAAFLTERVGYLTVLGLIEDNTRFVDDDEQPPSMFDVLVSYVRQPVSTDEIDSTGDE